MATGFRNYLTCTCCGGSAGCWFQHWNQDTGYGLCDRCRDWIWGRGGCLNPEDFYRTYGTPGVNFLAWPAGHPAVSFNKPDAAPTAESSTR